MNNIKVFEANLQDFFSNFKNENASQNKKGIKNLRAFQENKNLQKPSSESFSKSLNNNLKQLF